MPETSKVSMWGEWREDRYGGGETMSLYVGNLWVGWSPRNKRDEPADPEPYKAVVFQRELAKRFADIQPAKLYAVETAKKSLAKTLALLEKETK